MRRNWWGELVGRVELRVGVFLKPSLDWDCRTTRDVYIKVGALLWVDGPK